MYTQAPPYSFVSMSYPGDTFAVISYTGREGISMPFQYDILLASTKMDLDLEEILETPATFTCHTAQGAIPTHGVLLKFQQLHQVNKYGFYRAVLTSKLWWLTLIHHNQVFLEKKFPQVMEQILQQGGLSSHDYTIKLQQDYTQREFICQYRETLADFLSRWLEFEGIYYYFEHEQNTTRLVLTDTKIAHTDITPPSEDDPRVIYAPPSGLEQQPRQSVVYQFLAEHNIVPHKVRIKDYNYETPSLEVKGEVQVNDMGKGVDYLYGDGFTTPSQASKLADIRSQEHTAGKLVFHGEGSVPFMRPGHLFTLKNHFRSEYNSNYLLTGVEHRGDQTGYLVSGLHDALSEREATSVYSNSFTAIPADVQYRPQRKTRWPRISGTLTAKIDASQSGKYAELDDQGRYKVILPFDLSGRKDGHASCWLRMIQPYAGDNHGIHFPLHKDTEVLLTFLEGNPDRPVIAGAVPNPENPSQVINESQTMCKITTGGQNKIHMEDKEGSQRILLSSPTSGTWFRMGAPNDPPAVCVTASENEDDSGWSEPEKDKDGFRWSTEGNWYGAIGQHMSVEVGGNSTKVVVGGEETIIAGFDNKTVLLAKTDLTVGGVLGITAAGIIEIKAVKALSIATGIEYEIGGIEKVELRPSKTEVHEDENNVSAASTDIADEKTMIGMAFSAINEMNNKIHSLETELAEAKTSIGTTETKLREDINQVLSQEMNAIEAAIDIIGEKVGVGDAEINTYMESTEITEKVFL